MEKLVAPECHSRKIRDPKHDTRRTVDEGLLSALIRVDRGRSFFHVGKLTTDTVAQTYVY